MKYLALLPLLAACSSPARAPITNTTPTTRLALRPIQLMGPEGRHSASHSSSVVTGELALTGQRATLTLDFETSVSHVHCNPALMGSTRQACADPSARDSQTTTRITLTGSADFAGDTLAIRVADRERNVAMTCKEDALGYTCALADAAIFGFVHAPPSSMAFARPAARRHYELPAAELADPVGTVHLAGQLSVGGSAATIELAVDGRAPKQLTLPVSWAPAGIVMRDDGVSLICTERGATLECDLSANPGVFGRPAFYGRVQFIARRG